MKTMFSIFLFLSYFFSSALASHALGHKRSHRRLASSLLRDLDPALDSRSNTTTRNIDSRSSIPSGWSILVSGGNDGGGCYIDYGTPRTLGGGINVEDYHNSVMRCLNNCQLQNYRFGGVEFGSECYCSNYPRNIQPAPKSECNMPCAGDSSQTCGSAWRITIYTRSSTTTPDAGTYSLQGCVSDGEARALTGYSVVEPGLTIESCTDTCAAKGFTLAGVEYGQECYCGNSLSNGQGNALDASACNVNCIGDGSQNCGGAWAMSLYKLTAATPKPDNPSAWTYLGCKQDSENRIIPLQLVSAYLTVDDCLAQCSMIGARYGGVEFGQECYCGDSLNGGVAIPESSCSSTCSGGGTTNCGGGWALSLWTTASGSGSGDSTTTTTTTTPAQTTATTTTRTPTPPASTSIPAGWDYVWCAIDSEPRALTGYANQDFGVTINKCLTYCDSQGFKFGGVENGDECRCGNRLENNSGKKAPDSECMKGCSGDGAKGNCGGDWRLSLFSTLKGDALRAALGSAATTTTAQAPVTTTTTANAPPAQTTPTPPPPNTGGSYTPTTYIPGGGPKFIWTHFIVGNSYPYDYNQWMRDIRLAKDNGIDGFALNFGPESWQLDRMRDAYNAARDSGTGFKMMLSFDIAEFNCGDGSRVDMFQSYVRELLWHPAAAQVDGKQAVTTFMGQDCSFGQGSTNNGWATIFGSNAGNIYFMPAYTSDPRGLGGYNIQSLVNWGSAWPEGGNDMTTDRDRYFMGLLNGWGKKYIGTVSPCFATQMSYKNWIWRGDGFQFSQKWEQLISMRDQIDQVELISWNDYGESTYIGPIAGDMPGDARSYANDKFPHSDILSLNNFYARAWKDGKWPTITKDQVWVMARPHAVWAVASQGYGPPSHREFTQDNLYAQVHLTAPASVTLCAGSSCSTKQGQAGVNRFSQPLAPGQGIRVTVTRNGATTVDLSPNYTFQSWTERYNFNYFIKSS